MDWQHVAFDWTQVRAFLAAVETGSFSAAARAMGSTQPTIGRQVSALEQELGVALFQRVGRGLELTPTALELVEHARAMGEAALRLSRVAAGQSLSLEGTVCISAGEVFAAHLLPTALTQIRKAHPGIRLEIVASNQSSDLGRRQADIALRNYRPEQSDLVTRKVRVDQAYLYATPGYLESLGGVGSLEELSAADFIAFDHSEVFMNGLNAMGLRLSVASFPWVSESQQVQWAFVTGGAGVGVMVAEVGDADSRVVRVLPEEIAFPFETWLTSHREVRTSRRVRVVFDHLARALEKLEE